MANTGTRTSPVKETAIHLHAAAQRVRKLENARAGLSHLEDLPDEPCGVTWDGNDYCTKHYGHQGPHNILSPQLREDLYS